MGIPAVAQPHAAPQEASAPATLTLWAIGIAGCAAAATAFTITLDVDERVPVADAALVAWITVAYVLGGLVAWSRRPESALGPLMVVAGFGPFLSRLSELDAALPHAVGEICRLLPVVLFVHVFLAYPTGALTRPLERALVISGYAAIAGFGVVGLPDYGILEVAGRPQAAEVVFNLGRLAIVAFVLVAAALLVARAYRSGMRVRRAAVLGCFVLAFISVGVGLFAKILGWPAAEPIKWIAFGLIGVAPVLFLARFVHSRLARSAVAGLFVELSSEPAPADLRDALARVLRDPDLDLVYWLPEFGTYANLEGRAVDLDALGPDRTRRLVDSDGIHVAALVHDRALEDEPELLEAATAAAAISLENGHLHAELRAQLEELRGSRARIVQAGQRERQRLERNLHDGAQQRLIALSLELRMLEERVAADPETRDALDRAREEITRSLEELRDVARGIHPAVVSAHGLAVALEQLAARAPVAVDLRVEIEGRLPEELEIAAYYVVSESLSNLAKHAGATRARIEVTREDEAVLLEVVDDGVGGADPERGSGLRGLADRVEAMNGRLQVWTPRGGGTRVRAEIPCE